MEIKMLEHKMEMYKEKGKELTIEEVQTELCLRFERHKKSPSGAKVTDYALYMVGKFRGKCNFCGKIGHKASECHLLIAGKTKPEMIGSNENQTKFEKTNESGKRDSLFCVYCNKKGHGISECRKKKRDESGGMNEANMVKALACMAKSFKSDYSENQMGFCVVCDKWGLAYQECPSCGEDSGCYFIPDPDRKAPSSTDSDEDEDEEESNESDYFTDITKAEKPLYVIDDNPKYIFDFSDELRKFLMETLFGEIYDELTLMPMEVNKFAYVAKRKSIMEKFDFITVLIILRNHENINFNIRLHNDVNLPTIKQSQKSFWVYSPAKNCI
jgi:hypothetical protein